jgi:polyisoprenoid-binding protein YceI
MRRLGFLLLLLPFAATASTDAAGHMRAFSVAVTPACCSVGFTAYALGVFPIEGRFGDFEGKLVVGPPSAREAHAEARIDAASLSLDGGPIEADVKSPAFLDAARHTQILFNADAPPGGRDDRLEGHLTIRGVTLPVTLRLQRDGALVTAEARISRSAYGMTARPILAGDTIAIRITARLPE